MDDILLYAILGCILCLFIGYILGSYIQKLKTKALLNTHIERTSQLQNSLITVQQKLADEVTLSSQLQKEKEHLGNQIIRNQGDLEHLREKNSNQAASVEKLQERFTKEFENLANKILEDKSERFTQRNEQNIKNILSPLQDKINLFEISVIASQKENISIHSALKEQLSQLQLQNIKITQEAENLTKALKGDSKIQGNWGELVLERVLEKSGLEKDREYSVQKSFNREDGSRVLPDVIIHLPEGKKMVVDSKVSLTDYERFVNAEDSDKNTFLKNHVRSLKRHISQLSAKRYEDLYTMESPDFVLLFVPIEPAFAVALNEDTTLYNKAFEQNIVIVTPTTLLATLRTIDSMWTNEKRQRNAIEIARQAGALYDKFVGFVEDLNKVGKRLDDTKTEYSSAMNKLVSGRGNVITSIEKLKNMGAKAKKAIPSAILELALEQPQEEKH